MVSIRGICISARNPEELNHVCSMIAECSDSIEIFTFSQVLEDKSILDKCDFILPIGGDGTIAWLVETFFQTFGSVQGLKPLVPVIRPESIGYLKQLDLENFKNGFMSLLNGDYSVQSRTILKTNILGKQFVAVNEIFLQCAPHLGKFSISIKYDNSHFRQMTSTMADGAMISTSIGSTGWALSYRGQISLTEDALELVFAGGIFSSANFTLPRRPIKMELEVKNPTIIDDTVDAYNQERIKQGLKEDKEAFQTLNITYGPRVIIDGKVIAFGVTEIEIDSSFSIPFVFLHQETVVDKARKLTKQPNVK